MIKPYKKFKYPKEIWVDIFCCFVSGTCLIRIIENQNILLDSVLFISNILMAIWEFKTVRDDIDLRILEAEAGILRND